MKMARSLELLKDFANLTILPGLSALFTVGVVIFMHRMILKSGELTVVDVMVYSYLALHLTEARIRRDISEWRKTDDNANS